MHRKTGRRLPASAPSSLLMVLVLCALWRWMAVRNVEFTLDAAATRVDFNMDGSRIDRLVRTFDATKLTFLSANRIELNAGSFKLPSGVVVPAAGMLESPSQIDMEGAALDHVTISAPASLPVSIAWTPPERGDPSDHKIHLTIGGLESVSLQPAHILKLRCFSCTEGVPHGLFDGSGGTAEFTSTGQLGHETTVFPGDHTLRLAVVPEKVEIQGLPVEKLSFQGNFASTVQGGTLHFREYKEEVTFGAGEAIVLKDFAELRVNDIHFAGSADHATGLQIEASGLVRGMTIGGRDVLPSLAKRYLGESTGVELALVVATLLLFAVTLASVGMELFKLVRGKH